MNTSVLVCEMEQRLGACLSECSAAGHVVSATLVGKLWSVTGCSMMGWSVTVWSVTGWSVMGWSVTGWSCSDG